MGRKLVNSNELMMPVTVKGMTLEVPQSVAERKDTYRIGDNVKVLVKTYSGYKSHPGVIVGFDNFNVLPTIVVAYLNDDYGNPSVQFAYLHEKTEDLEICRMSDAEMQIDKGRTVDILDNQIVLKERELLELKGKKDYFVRNFAKYFEEGT